MLIERSLSAFFIQWLATIAFLFVLMTIPFLVKKFLPTRYRGIIRTVGDILGSPIKVMGLTVGQLIGLLLVTVFLYQNSLDLDSLQNYSFIFLFIFITFITLVYGWRLYKLEERSN